MGKHDRRPAAGKSMSVAEATKGGERIRPSVAILCAIICAVGAIVGEHLSKEVDENGVVVSPTTWTAMVDFIQAVTRPTVFADACLRPAAAAGHRLSEYLADGGVSARLANDGFCDCVTRDGSSDEPDTGACVTADVLDAMMTTTASPTLHTTPNVSEARATPSAAQQEVDRLQQLLDIAKNAHEGEFQTRVNTGAKWLTKFKQRMSQVSRKFEIQSGKFNRKVEKIQLGQIDVDEEEMEKLQKQRAALSRLDQEQVQGEKLLLSTALGKDYEFHTLLGKCFTITKFELDFRGGSADPDQFHYMFELCPFHNATQRRAKASEVEALRKATGSVVSKTQQNAELADEKKNAAERYKKTTLGFWSSVYPGPIHNLSYIVPDVPEVRLASPSDIQMAPYPSDQTKRLDAFSSLHFGWGRVKAAGTITPVSNVSLYNKGDDCWQGPARTVSVVFVCNLEDVLLDAFENGKCTYEMLFGTPSACTADVVQKREKELAALKAKI